MGLWSSRYLAVPVCVAALTGCGVPTASAPMDRGSAPPIIAEQGAPAPAPRGPDAATDAVSLVALYLQAAAWGNSTGGDRPGAVDQAVRTARTFMTDEAALAWSAGTRELTLVRVTLGAQSTDTEGATTVQARLEPVGILDDVGSVRPPTSKEAISWVFRVVYVDGGRQRRLAGAPAGLMLDVGTIANWYEVRSVYFWSADTTGTPTLVPDRRYLPKAVNGDKVPKEIWRWLATGPSDALASSVAALPHNVNLKDHVVIDQQDDKQVMVLNLTSEAANPKLDLERLVIQFRWSMRPSEIPVELRVEGVKKAIDGSSDRYLQFNPARWPTDQIEPTRLLVTNGQVRQVYPSGVATPALLDNAVVRSGVVSAGWALASGERQYVALVRKDEGPRGRRLWLGQLIQQGTARVPEYRATEVTGSALSRPTWLGGLDARVLLARDGGLVAATMDGKQIEINSVPSLPAGITAVTAAPDGRRLALVAGGRAYVAALKVEGDELTVVGIRGLDAGLAEVRGIGWSREDRLLVGGVAAGESPLVTISVDGTQREALERAALDNLGTDNLVVYPADPTSIVDRVLAMFQWGGAVYNVYGITVQQMSVVDGTASASPGAVPTAGSPFFAQILW